MTLTVWTDPVLIENINVARQINREELCTAINAEIVRRGGAPVVFTDPPAAGVSTQLNGSVTAGDAVIVVDDTTGFPATGYIYIYDTGVGIVSVNEVQYTGITPTQFTGCTGATDHLDNMYVRAGNTDIVSWRKPHIDELRSACLVAHSTDCSSDTNPGPVWNDPTILADRTVIRQTHIAQLRAYTNSLENQACLCNCYSHCACDCQGHCGCNCDHCGSHCSPH